MIDGMPAGICFREDTDAVTNNNSEFIPHFVNHGGLSKRSYKYVATKYQQEIREKLYGKPLDKNLYNYSALHGPFSGEISDVAPEVTLITNLQDASKHVHRCHCGGGCPSYYRASNEKTITNRTPLSRAQLMEKR